VVDGREFGVEPICAVLKKAGVQVTPSSYYAAKSRPPSARAVRDADLFIDIEVAHQDNLGVYGALRVRRAQPRGGPDGPVHRGAAHARRGTAWHPAGEVPQDHHR
jgi:hypothetical protein